ncbi:hypothetical protein [Nocardioides perillae]|uniref:Uncharacterized protein n=1 Tax=Nocardioides perillae TaxID=1119534 RepID=A0A7Y9USV7_9ACTN|nr:hypothetical protein [Nocardioides perillae]NYG56609.1 hypothetical protein [Nocardioides perillae]
MSTVESSAASTGEVPAAPSAGEQALVLVVGLVVVAGLLYASVFAMAAGWAASILLAAALAAGACSRPTPSARPLRMLVAPAAVANATFGAFAFLVS